jgi:hypothetical protein
MTLTVEMPADLEQRLQAEAARRGLTLGDFALQLLEESAPAAQPLTKGAQVIAQWEREGVLGIWGDREDIGDSSEYARKLRRRAESRLEEQS